MTRQPASGLSIRQWCRQQAVTEARRDLHAAREFLKKQLKEPAPAELSKALEQLDAIDKKLEQALEKLEED